MLISWKRQTFIYKVRTTPKYTEHLPYLLVIIIIVCSLEVTCDVLASCGATYANNGTSPITGEKAMSFDTVKNTLQIMYSCGMYDYSGEWACTIGLPGNLNLKQKNNVTSV